MKLEFVNKKIKQLQDEVNQVRRRIDENKTFSYPRGDNKENYRPDVNIFDLEDRVELLKAGIRELMDLRDKKNEEIMISIIDNNGTNLILNLRQALALAKDLDDTLRHRDTIGSTNEKPQRAVNRYGVDTNDDLQEPTFNVRQYIERTKKLRAFKNRLSDEISLANMTNEIPFDESRYL